MDNISSIREIIRRAEDGQRVMEAAKLLRRAESGSDVTHQLRRLIAAVLAEDNSLPADLAEELRAMLPASPLSEERATERLQIRCTPSQKACICLLADKHAGGNISRLVLDTLERAYPTI